MRFGVRLYQGTVAAKERYEQKGNRPLVWLSKLALEAVMRIIRVL